MKRTRTRTREFAAGVDSLESRVVLSVAQPAAQVVPLRGSGTLVMTSHQSTEGGVSATVALNGKFAGLGAAAGPITVDVPTGGLEFTASGTITLADGDQLDIEFAGSSQTPKPHATRAVGQFQVNVTAGTGAYANAAGVGKITIIQNLVTGSETFKINGRLQK
jgi:hypothetical protein